jgi:activating signal cointegrator complex subunit 1
MRGAGRLVVVVLVGRRERMVFDATGILERYEDLVWMEDVPLEKVAICRMGAKKTGYVVDGVEDEVYEVDAEVGF